MIDAILKRGTLVSVIMTMILLLGAVAAFRVPVQMIPDLDTKVVSITTRWPGATPQDVEKEILIEQEDYLRGLPGIKRITSTASTGVAEIELEFPFGSDSNEMLLQVNNALSQVPSYPENVDEPVLRADSFSYNPFLMFRIAPLPDNPKNVDVNMELDFVKDNVQTLFERLPGVSQVNISGGAERQIRILIHPAKLAERDISLAEVRQAIRARNQDRSGGDLDVGKRRYLVRIVGRFDNLEELGQLIIKRRGDAITRLSEVADISLTHGELRSFSLSNGKPNLRLNLTRQTGANVIDIKNQALPLVDEVNQDILNPRGLHMSLTNDDVRYVQSSLTNVISNMIIGAVLAALILFLFLRCISTTFIGVIGMPVCVISAFLGLLLTGRTINVISLAGIAFAVGMTVDNAIVVLESIQQERHKGKSRFQAARDGVARVWNAVATGTMTTVLVFIPLFFIQEEAGQLFSDIGIGISVSILVSMLVAVTLIPVAYVNLPSRKLARDTGSIPPGNPLLLRAICSLFNRGWKRVAVVLGFLTATIAGFLFLVPPAEYLPEGEEAKTFSTLIAPPGYSLNETKPIAEELQAQLLPAYHADPALFAEGKTDIPSLSMLIVFADSQSVRVIAETTVPSEINALMEAVDSRMRTYPGMRVFSSRGSIISSNDGGTRAVALDINGNSLPQLYQTANAIFQRASEVIPQAQINSEPPSLSLGQPLIQIKPKWERLEELGLTLEDFGFTVSALSDGAFVEEFFLDDDKVDIYVFSPRAERQTLENLKQIPILTPRGTLPLDAIATITETVDTAQVRRVNAKRTVTLHIIPPRSMPLETGVNEVREKVVRAMQTEGKIPADISVSLTGASDQLEATRKSLGANMWIALALCYLQLVIIYRHWGHPLFILTTVPLGILGAIGGLWALNFIGARLPLIGLAPVSQAFDMITMLGFLILLGTVVNNPILIVERTIENLKSGGMSPFEAAREAVSSRLRPILMTTVSTIFGLAPLVLIPGAGTELYRGLGAIVLFGLAFTTIVTLVFLPSLLILWFQLTGHDKKSTAPVAEPAQ